ncbi:hypothetical protein BVZ54_01734B, partial [Haemophilus influenzae]
DER